ncbi:hypothetical protein DAI22_09g101000 [Oryza sativa Japonica Group]|nr:hypothetical protein DAI22_09g101000 [Oryza sativa Japonica Group]
MDLSFAPLAFLGRRRLTPWLLQRGADLCTYRHSYRLQDLENLHISPVFYIVSSDCIVAGRQRKLSAHCLLYIYVRILERCDCKSAMILCGACN